MPLKFEMWKYERKPGEIDGVMSRFTDGTGRWTESWWSSPPEDIDHVGIDYLSQRHRHPNVKTARHEAFVKQRYKEEMVRLENEDESTSVFDPALLKVTDFADLDGKELKMIYSMDSGYGILSGVDKDGKVYVLSTIGR